MGGFLWIHPHPPQHRPGVSFEGRVKLEDGGVGRQGRGAIVAPGMAGGKDKRACKMLLLLHLFFILQLVVVAVLDLYLALNGRMKMQECKIVVVADAVFLQLLLLFLKLLLLLLLLLFKQLLLLLLLLLCFYTWH